MMCSLYHPRSYTAHPIDHTMMPPAASARYAKR